MTICALTGPLTFGHESCAVTGWLELRIHDPGPRSGTTATAKDRVNVPVTTPFETLTLGSCAGDFAIEPVATAKCVAMTTVVVVNGATVVVVLLVVDVDDVVGFDAIVVEGLVEETVEGTCSITNLVDGLAVAVSVNSSTRSSRGLDHITRWALRSEK